MFLWGCAGCCLFSVVVVDGEFVGWAWWSGPDFPSVDSGAVVRFSKFADFGEFEVEDDGVVHVLHEVREVGESHFEFDPPVLGAVVPGGIPEVSDTLFPEAGTDGRVVVFVFEVVFKTRVRFAEPNASHGEFSFSTHGVIPLSPASRGRPVGTFVAFAWFP